MAGNKNYQSYREELARLIPFLFKYEDDTGFGSSFDIEFLIDYCVNYVL